MKTRREFITLFGGAAAASAWPPAINAQQQAIPVIGFLHSADAAPFGGQLAAFRQGLKESGFVVGQNVAIEYRWAEGKNERLPDLAADLVRRKVDVIAAMGGGYSNLSAKAATTTIPIVFNTGADPVKMGLVPSLNRPGGNITGISFFAEELASKAIDLLHELVPSAKTIGLMVNPNNPEMPRQSAEAIAAARVLGLKVEVVNASTPAEIDRAFDILTERQAKALHILADAFYGSRVTQLVELAALHKIPTMYYRREYPDAGGLISYGTSVNDAYRQTAIYVARILKGAKPADLPVMQSTKFEFIINLKTAKSLGIDVPGGFSARADEVIE